MFQSGKNIEYAEDDTEPVSELFKIRAPWLVAGLTLGLLVTFVTSRFEEVLAENIHLAFFIPFVVYIAAAIGTQTQAIYTRDLKTGRADFFAYLKKETILGIIFGISFGVISALIAYVWLHDLELAKVLLFSVSAAVLSAPVVALLITEALQLLSEDPAAGGGPIATVVQDTLSILIYGTIATALLL